METTRTRQTTFLPRALTVGCAALALLFGACGGGSNEADSVSGGDGASDRSANPREPSTNAKDPAKALDACKLVTKAEAEKATSSPMAEAEKDTGRAAGCTYHTSDTTKPDTVYVRVGSGRAEKGAFDLGKTTYSNPIELKGYGDDAFIIKLDAPVVQVHVLKGDTYLTVVVTDLDGKDALVETAKALAKTALERL